MNDPWDVKSVRQSNQYMSCMKINGVPLLPPLLSKECRKEMHYYKLLAKEVENRIQSLKPFIIESDSESSEDKTDAPELPESEQSYEPVEDNIFNNVNAVNNNAHDKVQEIICTSNTYDNITSNPTDSVSSKLVIDLSLSINDTGRNLDSVNSSQTLNDLPERDCEYPKQKLCDVDNNSSTIKGDKLSFSVSINKDVVDPGATLYFSQDGPSSLSSKSFTGSLNDIHTESVKASPIPLTRQRSYTVLKPSPLLLAHLEVQSINTGIDVTSISMSESMSNINYSNKKRRSWDLESAKEKWSSMALELKGKSLCNNNTNPAKSPVTKATTKKAPQQTPPKAKSLALDKAKRSPPKITTKSDPIQKIKKTATPVHNSQQNNPKVATNPSNSQKKEPEATNKKPISESDDPATRVRELYEKIQKQQIIQMANLVEKQKKEQMLLQQVFEEQNNLLFTQLKSICPKSPNEMKEAWVENKDMDRGPVSLSQLINHKPPDISDSPVLSTLTETNSCINYCDNVLKKSRDITGSMKKPLKKSTPDNEKPKPDGSITRTHSPVRKNTPTSRKLVYETSASDRDYDPILTDRTNDTMADLNVTFPSDNEDCQPLLHKTVVMCGPVESRPNSAACRPTDEGMRCGTQPLQNSMNSMCLRPKSNMFRAPTPQERAAASKIVAHAKGFFVRRLMRTERVQATVQTIKDALLCALQLHQDREGIRGADVDLHRRLIQQITAACYTLHDTFIASSASERCAMIAADRSRQRSLAARISPAIPTHVSHRNYRPTDLMSQSHSGVFPTRHKRPAPSLMTQSNYETFSSDKSVRRYMPSPRRRPWR